MQKTVGEGVGPVFKLAAKYCAIVLGFTLLGFSIAFLWGSASDEGWLEQWQKIAPPPEPVEKLLSPYYIQSSSGTIYEYSPPALFGQACRSDCWIKVDAFPTAIPNPYNHSSVTPLKDCGWIPNLDRYADSIAMCQWWGPGGTLTSILALDRSGSLYSWTKGKGEGGGLLIIYGVIFCTPVGFLAGLAVAIVVAQRDFSMRTKAKTQT